VKIFLIRRSLEPPAWWHHQPPYRKVPTHRRRSSFTQGKASAVGNVLLERKLRKFLYYAKTGSFNPLIFKRTDPYPFLRPMHSSFLFVSLQFCWTHPPVCLPHPPVCLKIHDKISKNSSMFSLLVLVVLKFFYMLNVTEKIYGDVS
jgi:hypothetical protein